MGDFKEFLEDYEAKEKEEREHFFRRLDAGKISEDERYPPTEKFIKLKEPIATPFEVNIWGVIPFFGLAPHIKELFLQSLSLSIVMYLYYKYIH